MSVLEQFPSPSKREIAEAWISTLGRVAGLGIVLIDCGAWIASHGRVFEPLVMYAGLVLFGLGDVVGGVLGSLLEKRSAK